MRLFIALVLFFGWLSLNAKEADFISDLEYGMALYKNPRGVACAKCHGIKGEKQEITFYYEKGEKKILYAPKINHLDFKTFKDALSLGKGMMPKYNLNLEEIQAIYLYITSLEHKEEHKDSLKP
ncbi:cytochrome c [Helicobacter pylori]|uniref:c-type cytochrome n=1 Tax=Helicobacter pylori TaxID=210 RepID=UPI000FDD562E|nr:c-type cytochrome [Helicobacter pylori]RVZ03330.1 cytochrome c [Helicobacter pylori]